MKGKKRLVSVAEYAEMCQITRQAVHNRVEAGLLKFAKKQPVLLIDISKYPPLAVKLGRRPYKSGLIAA